MCSFSRSPRTLHRFLVAIWTLALLLILPRAANAQSNPPPLFPERPFLPQFNPLCDGALVACLDADRFAGHAYAHGVVSPATDSRDTALSFPYGVSLGLFGRIAAGASTDFHVWRDVDGLHNQHGPLRLNLSALVWPLVPFDQSPQSGQDESGGSHFTFRRDLRVGIDFQQELRIGPFEGANSLGLFGNLATLRLVASKGLGPLELIANGGALFDWQGTVSTGTISGQVGLHLPFFRALKAFVEGGVQGFGTRTESRDAVQRQGAIGGGLAFRLRDRVDVGVDVLHGFGDVAKWTVLVRFLTLSVGESYQGRAATPIVELGADVTVEIVRQVREYIASLPIDPKLDENCVILDEDHSVMGAYGKRTAEGHFCEVDGAKVPIGHDFFRPGRTKDLLCSDRAMTECVLVLRDGKWIGIRRVILDARCRLIDLSDQSTLQELGHPSDDGKNCRWSGERQNGRYAPIREWNELPMGTRLYADGAKTRVCADPRLSRCVYMNAQLGWNTAKHIEQGIGNAGKKWANDNAQTAKNTATVVENVATGKVTIGSLADAAVGKAVRTCRWMLDGVKAAWNNPQRVKECVDDILHKAKTEATAWMDKPPGEKVEDLAGGATTLGADAAAGVAGGKIFGAGAGVLGGLRRSEKAADAVGDVVDEAKNVRKGLHGVAEHTDDAAARRRIRQADHDGDRPNAAEHDAPVLPVHAHPFSDRTRAHILEGEVNKWGEAKGWHYEPSGDASKGTYVIAGTRSAMDFQGVYEANVMIEGVKKGARSSFFRQHWTLDRIEREVMEAYGNKKLKPKNPGTTFVGFSSSGLEIEMRIEKSGRIQSAYPVPQRR